MNTCKLTEFFSSDYHLFGVHLHHYFLEKLPSSKAASMSTGWLKQQQTNKPTIQISNLSAAKIVFDSICRLSLSTFWIHIWFKEQWTVWAKVAGLPHFSDLLVLSTKHLPTIYLQALYWNSYWQTYLSVILHLFWTQIRFNSLAPAKPQIPFLTVRLWLFYMSCHSKS